MAKSCGFMRPIAHLSAFLACCFLASGRVHPNEIVLHDGRLRVQALSPTLLRVEPLGPKGFEDRTTFAVVNRSFPGIPIWKESESALETVLSTAHYKVHLQGNVGVYWYVTDMHGAKLYEAVDDLALSNFEQGFHKQPNLLHWPSPHQVLKKKGRNANSYALVDAPRFFAPEWGPTPGPKGTMDPALATTNGFDFGNNIDGDTYVFLLGKTLESWSASRQDFLQLTGPCPLLPDYAYGTWFTRWHNYTDAEARSEVQQWEDLKLPLDVWGLDMNWRNTSSAHNNEMDASVGNSDGSDWYYDHPDTTLFANFSDWFGFLHKKNLKTYFNDHPYPVAARGAGGLQTSPEEVQFRWEGLSKWMDKGLDFWWFDRNWRFSIPPPFVNTSRTSASWEGLDNAAWGSYVYHKTSEMADKQKCSTCSAKRSISLTKFAGADWRPGIDSVGHQEHPAHHRFPVWWTGDGVPLQASVESMVDAGVHDFKPFVHSDCGGDYRGSSGDLMRWTAHCAFGTIMRFHGSDHRPWSYDDQTTTTIKRYLEARYKLLPSLIAAGQHATQTGFPLAARGDMYWPELAPASATNQQYVFLHDILVAPIWDTAQNVTTRSVWIPPGSWEDAWDGSITKAPQGGTWLNVTQPFERQPMWHRCDGGLIVLAGQQYTRVEDQDWNTLTLEAYPAMFAQTTQRSIFERGAANRTDIELITDANGKVSLTIGSNELAQARAWVVRLHLQPGYVVDMGMADGDEAISFEHLYANAQLATDFFPLGGAGTLPAQQAGPVVEIHLPHSANTRSVEVTLRKRQPEAILV